MKGTLITLVVICVGIHLTLTSDTNSWDEFKHQYGKYYETPQEEKYRFDIFQENLRKIEEHNGKYELGLVTHTLGVNKFADSNQNDFLSRYNVETPIQFSSFKIPRDIEIPKEIDWRQYGAVSSVQDQGNCSSCWSFAITGALEAQYFLKYNKLVELSKQNLVDCGKLYARGLNGCNGAGVPVLAYYYIQDYGIETEIDYPYEAKEGDCRTDNSKIFTKVTNFVMIQANDEEAMRAAVGLVGPIAVAIDMRDLYLYKGGIFQSKECLNSSGSGDHAMLVVGYGSDNGVDYWLVKNSFGSDFGEDGYVRMVRGVNQCGIAMYAHYPVL